MPSLQSETASAERKLLYSQWILLLMSFFCYFITQTQRINMSITILKMVNYTDVYQGKKDPRLHCSRNSSNVTEESGVFVWSLLVQSQILASTIYGMALLRLPAEFISKHTNHKWLPFFGTAVATGCSFLTPVFAHIGGYYVIGLQLFKALAQQFIRPSLSLMIEQWADENSASSYMAYAETGFPISNFLTIIGAGILSDTPEFGWESVFYISGAMGVVWCLIWGYLVCHICYPTPLISGSEPPVSKQLKKAPVPWLSILSSKCVWAYILVGVAFYWAYSFNILLIPLYLKMMFDVSLEWNTLASAIPNLLQAFLFVLGTFVTERFTERKIVSKALVRKSCVVLGLSVFAGSNILLTFTQCGQAISTFVLMIGVGAIGLTVSALINLPLDMSPQFSGLLSGLMNTIGAAVGSLVPLMVAHLAESEEGITDVKLWYKVFNASTLWSVVAMIFFLAFGSTEVQTWDDSCTQPSRMNDTSREEDIIPPLQYRISSSTEQIVIPESESANARRTSSIVDTDKLSELLLSNSLRRSDLKKPLP